jgi:phosphatidylserine decarboxylase
VADSLSHRAPRSDFAPLRRVLPLAPEGAKIALALLAGGLILVLVRLGVLGAIVLGVGAFAAWFFRDPERMPPDLDGIVLSGADGKVVDVGEGPAPHAPGANYKRVAVFMSPLDVHVNRAPVEGEVTAIKHTRGEFHAAFSDYASERNERNLIVFTDKQGRSHGMVQIAGYLARRIVCRLHPHDPVLIGQRVGLIMFGSRVDHFLPPQYRVTVAVGQHVKAGESVIGELAQ